MRKFVGNVMLFCLPIVVCLIVLVVPFYYAGLVTYELTDVDDCIEMQRTNPEALYGIGYSSATSWYKLKNADYYNASIIALGTSRVMQFKKDYFEDSFYNCGGAVAGNYNEYINFLENLSYKPSIVILGLDAWVFNDEWNSGLSDYASFVEISKPNVNNMHVIKRIRQDWNIKWNFNQLDRYSSNIGFNGRLKDEGFMLDGSYYYGNTYRNPELQKDYNFVDTLDRIATGTRRFEWGDHIDKDTINQLENLLSYCKENEIYVIGFLAPFAPTMYTQMYESSNYGYLIEIEPACKDLFSKYNYEFYNYLDVSDFGVTDDYFIDGFHGSEVVYAYMVYDMCEKNSELKQFINVDVLEYLIDNAFDGKTFYNPDNR